MKNFPSQRMPCIPISKVGTLWEASQDVGLASYKAVCICTFKRNFTCICSSFRFTRCSLPFKNTLLKFEEFFPFPVFAKKGKIDPKTNFQIFWQSFKYIFGGVLILSLVRKSSCKPNSKILQRALGTLFEHTPGLF